MDRKELGFLAENIAARYLEERGYEILDKNYRKPWGEIDIVALAPEQGGQETDGERTVIFVEVKANKQETIGFNPETRADWNKMRKVKRTAALYMEREMGTMDREWQIDIITVTFDLNRKKAKIKHFKNV